MVSVAQGRTDGQEPATCDAAEQPGGKSDDAEPRRLESQPADTPNRGRTELHCVTLICRIEPVPQTRLEPLLLSESTMRSLITVLLALAQRTMALSFTEKVITSTAMGAYSVYAADVNGDGFVDVLSASRSDHRVRVFFNDGNIGNPHFTEQVITSTAD